MRLVNGDMISSYISQIMRDIFPKYEYLGVYRYQVFQQTDEKLELQIIRKRTGLPDILPVEMFPGVAGAFAQVQSGSSVLVMFADGDPMFPVVAGFAPKSEGTLHYPTAVILNAITSIDLGLNNLDNAVKWTGFNAYASGVKSSITSVITALGLVAAAIPFTIPPPIPTAPADPVEATTKSSKVRVE